MNEQSKHFKSKKFKPWPVIIFVVLVAFTLTLLDWFDVLAPFHHLNVTALSAIWGNAVVVVLFLLAYHMIDKRRLEIDEKRLEKEEKEVRLIENKKQIAFVMLSKTCETVHEQMSKAYVPEMIEKYVVPKLDFNNKALVNDPLFLQAIASLFQYDSQILQFAETGILDYNLFSLYEDLKSKTKAALNMRITFFDAYKKPASDANIMIATANEEYEKALENLENQLRRRGK